MILLLTIPLLFLAVLYWRKWLYFRVLGYVVVFQLKCTQHGGARHIGFCLTLARGEVE